MCIADSTYTAHSILKFLTNPLIFLYNLEAGTVYKKGPSTATNSYSYKISFMYLFFLIAQFK